jgi:hydroxymethylpyrimidine/phosphomethylpyrimidine kinase
MTTQSTPAVLAIGGSDSSAGAGIQADLKTLAAINVYGLSVITSITAQTSQGVSYRQDLSPEAVAAQLDAALRVADCGAAKIGMLGSVAVARVVLSKLKEAGMKNIVLDPVLEAEAGGRLADEALLSFIKTDLMPSVLLVTPNQSEAARLTGHRITGIKEVEAAAEDLLICGPDAVLITGINSGDREVSDYFATRNDRQVFKFPRLDRSAHGTGCTLSSAIAGFVAKNQGLPEAVGAAVNRVQAALKTAVMLNGWLVANQASDFLI